MLQQVVRVVTIGFKRLVGIGWILLVRFDVELVTGEQRQALGINRYRYR